MSSAALSEMPMRLAMDCSDSEPLIAVAKRASTSLTLSFCTSS